MSGWYYRKSGVLEDTNEGPFADGTLLQLAFDGKVSAKTLAVHQVHTRGQWVTLEQIPAVKQKIEEGEQQRTAAKAAQQREKERQKELHLAAKREAAEAEQVRLAEQRAASPITPFLTDGQPEAVVTKLYDRLQAILTPSEVIEYIAVQARPIVVAQDCVAITNRRLIIYRPKLLGQVQFDDFLWLYLSDAKMKEGIMFAELSFRVNGGQPLTIEYLPKLQARRIYQIAQHREEMAIEVRRQRAMEETRAGASNIVVNAAPAAATPPQALQAAAEDPVAKLQKLKQMLDAGLIEPDEYAAAKAKILAAF